MRKAGDSSHYKWVLVDKSNDNTPIPGVLDIDLPSVTSIIKATVAAPQLVPWAYRTTVEAVDVLLDAYEGQEWEEIFLNHDLDALLTENRLRPDDIRDERGGEGTAAHEYLEIFATCPQSDPPGMVHPRDPENEYERAIADWWRKTDPQVESAEQTVVSLKYGFAGTLDLAWHREPTWAFGPVVRPGGMWITDLKTRKREAREPYDSDLIQLDGLRIAFEETTGIPVAGTSVLMARDDGSWVETPSDAPRGIFLKVLDLYNALREV